MNHPDHDALASYRNGTLAPAELLEIDDHLAGCAECRQTVAARTDGGTAVRRFAEAISGEHLGYDAMERRVDGRSSPEEDAIVDEHIAICDDCREDLADFVRLRASMGQSIRRRRMLTAAVAAAAVLAVILLLVRREPARTAPPPRTHTVATATHPAPPAPVPGDPLQSLEPSLREVAAALRSGTLVSAGLLASLAQDPEQQRVAAGAQRDSPRIVSPAGVVVETDRPSFRWTTVPAGQFLVQVFDRNYSLVAESPRLEGTTWTTPSALPRGATYRWQLQLCPDDGATSIIPAPPAPPAMFHVIGERAFEKLAAARSAGSTLEAGLICMREGLLEEGVRLLEQYAKENPGVPDAAQLAQQARAAAKL